MRKPEQKVYDRMKRTAPKTLWLQRVENLCGEGMPDVYYDGPTTHGWVELKAANLPKRETSKLLGSKGLRQSQINWLLKANTKCAPAFILIQDNEGQLYLFTADHAAALNDYTVQEARAKGAVRGWNSIFKTIMNWKG